ncbi:MAG: DUF4382 domain-containing protein [Gemmatimonadales bacterium]
MTRFARWIVPTVAGLTAAVACYEDGNVTTFPPRPSHIRVLLTDAPFPFDSVDKVEVYIVSVAASTTADTGDTPGSQRWVTIATPRKRFDLLEVQQGATTLVGEGELPVDEYEAVRIVLNVDSSRIVYLSGAEPAVHWADSGRAEIAIHTIVQSPVAVPDAGADIVIDFDVGRSFRYDARGDGSFDFVPWIRAINRAATGSIAGTVLADSGDGVNRPIEKASITVYSGESAFPHTWQILATGRTEAAGHYRIAFLLPDTYIVSVAPPASVRSESRTDVAVPVALGVETQYSVTLAAFQGAVTIQGDLTITEGESTTLEAVVTDAQNQPIVNPTVTWQTLNPAVATLRDTAQYAVVTGQRFGSSKIVASSNGLTDTVTVVVFIDSSAVAARVRRARH